MSPSSFTLKGMRAALTAAAENATRLSNGPEPETMQKLLRRSYYEGRAEAYEEAVEMLDAVRGLELPEPSETAV